MVFNVTFYNISVISWWSVLLVEETGENHRPAASHWPAFSHMLYWIHLAMSEIQITTVVVIGTDWTVSCKSNYHTITTMTSPQLVIYYCLTIYVMKNNYIMYSIKSKITIWCFIQRDCSPSYKGEGVSIFLTWGKHLHEEYQFCLSVFMIRFWNCYVCFFHFIWSFLNKKINLDFDWFRLLIYLSVIPVRYCENTKNG